LGVETSKDEHFIAFRDRLRRFEQAYHRDYPCFKTDPLARFLIDVGRWSPMKGAVWGFAVVCLTYVIGISIHWISGREVAGITHTFIDVLYDVSLVPVVFGYYIWISTRPAYLFLKLGEHNIAPGGEKTYQAFVTTSLGVIHHRRIHALSLLTTLALVFYHIHGAAAGSGPWGSETVIYTFYYAIKVPFTWMFAWYMTGVIVLKAVMSVWRFRILLRQWFFRLSPGARDAFGGLKPLIDFTAVSFYFIVACGFGLCLLVARGLTLGYFRKDMLVHISLMLYVALSFLFVYLSLQPIQRLIEKTKKRIGQRLERYGIPLPSLFTVKTVCRFACFTLAPVLLFFLLF